MDHKKIYYAYMSYIKTLNRNKKDGVLYESHHIIPRSIDPDEEKNLDNIVLLTLREHFLAHIALFQMYSGLNKQKMALALHFLTRLDKYGSSRILSSRMFERVRAESNKYNSQRQKGKKLSEAHKKALSAASPWKGKQSPFSGKKHTEAAKLQNSIKHLGKPAWNRGIPIDENKQRQMTEKAAAVNRGKKLTKDHRHKISCSHIGLKHSEETKKKIASRITRYNLITGKRWYGYDKESIPVNHGTYDEYKHSPNYVKRKYGKNKSN